VFQTNFAKIGVLICLDQWYPEAARITALMGAEILFYPTAIGWDTTEPDPALLIANNDKCGETEPSATLHNFSNAIDVHQLVHELAVALVPVVPLP